MTNLEHFKQKLLTLKTEITQRINAIDKDIKHEDMSSNWTEQATERENDEVLESLGNSSEQELVMINAALKRISTMWTNAMIQIGTPLINKIIVPLTEELIPVFKEFVQWLTDVDWKAVFEKTHIEIFSLINYVKQLHKNHLQVVQNDV